MIFANSKKIKELEKTIADQQVIISRLERRLSIRPSMAELMRESLGIDVDFSEADEIGKPPHYLSGIGEDDRKAFVIDANSVFENRAFKEITRYMINLFAYHALYKEDKDQMKYGQIACVAFSSFRRQFEDLHKEFLTFNKLKEEFDPLAILPE